MCHADVSEFQELIWGYKLSNGQEAYDDLRNSLHSHAALIMLMFERGAAIGEVIDAIATRIDPAFPDRSYPDRATIRAAQVVLVELLPIIRRALESELDPK